MLDIAAALLGLVAEGRRVAVATVVAVHGSAPRPAGASMAVSDDGAVVGSVSGGCVEGAVYDLAVEVLATGRAVRETFGISDEAAVAVGLTCGGAIDVLVAPLPDDDATFGQLRAAARGSGARVAVVAAGSRPDVGRALGARLPASGPRPPDETGLELVGTGASAIEVFHEVLRPPARLVVCGANDFAVALTAAAALMGYAVTVCDARPVFARRERFPGADDVVVAWPHRYLQAELDAGRLDERSVVCVLTHDPKFDVPLLAAAVRMPIAYVGAMGSRRTHEQREVALLDAGISHGELDRLHSPIGLDLGASTPQETAVAIVAEVLAARTGGTGLPLRDVAGPVHRSAPARRP